MIIGFGKGRDGRFTSHKAIPQTTKHQQSEELGLPIVTEGAGAPKEAVISSRVLPLVSGTKVVQNSRLTTHSPENSQYRPASPRADCM
ncbi:hypothetical protein E2C01_012433 [Portunus trituberculatus]|uniref:Uncharacterized protein n=1 Tax=Portunus trituberculatus TaxID=210409 RepID=A0A5B7DDZ0_PORTR|nr:hypothetical protein [Portunus trituberculatus]